MNLKGSVAIVTGGGTGIGRAVCHRLARAGARAVAINYSKSRDDAQKTAAELGKLGCEGWPVQADVADRAAAEEMVAGVARRYRRLDVLVNNAGTTRFISHPDLEALTEEVWDAVFDVNLKGAFWCARAAAPHLRRRRGAIVNMTSIAASRASGSSIVYGCSKAALVQLTRMLAGALAPEVRVNCVSPGLVATRWFRMPHGDEAASAQEQAFHAITPLAGVAGPDHVAQAVMGFIESDFVTGQEVIVDGGLSLKYGPQGGSGSRSAR